MFFLLSAGFLCSQTVAPDQPSAPENRQKVEQQKTEQSVPSPLKADADSQTEPRTLPAAPSATADQSKADQSKADQSKTDSEGKQSKRILWVVPNFGAVSAGAQLSPLSSREKFVIATHDSVDYSSFVWAGFLAAQSMALNSYPELHGGIAGYARYYWRAFADQASGAYFTEAIVPVITHEDPRYYTLGHGGFFHRTGYALAQVVVTKTDAGSRSFNLSEVFGNGIEAGLANLYYPPQERGLRKTAENWGTGLESAALNNIVKEFWPDIRHKLLRQK